MEITAYSKSTSGSPADSVEAPEELEADLPEELGPHQKALSGRRAEPRAGRAGRAADFGRNGPWEPGDLGSVEFAGDLGVDHHAAKSQVTRLPGARVTSGA